MEFDFNTFHFPKFDLAAVKSEAEIFEEKSARDTRKNEKLSGSKSGTWMNLVYKERIDYEISVINSMGFPGYFLIVADFIGHSKKQESASAGGLRQGLW
ncbi:MAG: hypothetical protein R2860_11950 [Desulfobacterales bacterium]